MNYEQYKDIYQSARMHALEAKRRWTAAPWRPYRLRFKPGNEDIIEVYELERYFKNNHDPKKYSLRVPIRLGTPVVVAELHPTHVLFRNEYYYQSTRIEPTPEALAKFPCLEGRDIGAYSSASYTYQSCFLSRFDVHHRSTPRGVAGQYWSNGTPTHRWQRQYPNERTITGPVKLDCLTGKLEAIWPQNEPPSDAKQQMRAICKKFNNAARQIKLFATMGIQFKPEDFTGYQQRPAVDTAKILELIEQPSDTYEQVTAFAAEVHKLEQFWSANGFSIAMWVNHNFVKDSVRNRLRQQLYRHLGLTTS